MEKSKDDNYTIEEKDCFFYISHRGAAVYIHAYETLEEEYCGSGYAISIVRTTPFTWDYTERAAVYVLELAIAFLEPLIESWHRPTVLRVDPAFSHLELSLEEVE